MKRSLEKLNKTNSVSKNTVIIEKKKTWLLGKSYKENDYWEKTVATGAPKKLDNSALTETVCQIAISCSTDNRRRTSEVIRIQHWLSFCSLRDFDWEDSDYWRLVPWNARFFFLSEFSVTIIHESQDCKRRGRTFLYLHTTTHLYPLYRQQALRH